MHDDISRVDIAMMIKCSMQPYQQWALTLQGTINSISG